MRPDTERSIAVALGGAQFLRLPRPCGHRVTVRRGTLWITIDGRPEDLELAAGQSHRFGAEADGPVLIGTLGGTAEFALAGPVVERGTRRRGGFWRRPAEDAAIVGVPGDRRCIA
jgi:hypothetical protein